MTITSYEFSPDYLEDLIERLSDDEMNFTDDTDTDYDWIETHLQGPHYPPLQSHDFIHEYKGGGILTDIYNQLFDYNSKRFRSYDYFLYEYFDGRTYLHHGPSLPPISEEPPF